MGGIKNTNPTDIAVCGVGSIINGHAVPVDVVVFVLGTKKSAFPPQTGGTGGNVQSLEPSAQGIGISRNIYTVARAIPHLHAGARLGGGKFYSFTEASFESEGGAIEQDAAVPVYRSVLHGCVNVVVEGPPRREDFTSGDGAPHLAGGGVGF